MDDRELRAQLETCHAESYGWAMACCRRDQIDAETVLQTVYLKVLQGKARFDGRASFKTWLFAVIRNTAADERRRSVFRRFGLARVEEAATRAQREESPDETVYRSEIQLQFREALARLPGRQREVLQLVFYHDLTLSEAAAVMNVSIGSARTHYERGKKTLRRLMAESRVFDESGFGREENREAVP
ncbi:MAG TPA: sigma-70 family RNA polymerase sigma factor [Blastocatellia bacterium]|nr:sigma-70 family RNA polymerase sigma factor [Blastocatellia bacterium]